MLRDRLARHAARSVFSFVFPDTPDVDVDAFVTPIDRAELLCARRDATGHPSLVFGSGPAALLRAAFALGCDDYLREPWEPDELDERLSRASAALGAALSFGEGDYLLHGTSLVIRDSGEVVLGGPESAILRLLLRNCGKIVDRQALWLAVWGRRPDADSRALDVHISSLRRKMGRNLIRSVRGKGYVLLTQGPKLR